MVSEKILKERLSKMKKEELEDFVLGIVNNPSAKPYLQLLKQVEACQTTEVIKNIKPFTPKGSEELELVAKYYDTLRRLIAALEFFSDKLGLTKFLSEEGIKELDSNSSAEKSSQTYEDLVKTTKAK